jgi:hypothetical protein
MTAHLVSGMGLELQARGGQIQAGPLVAVAVEAGGCWLLEGWLQLQRALM